MKVVLWLPLFLLGGSTLFGQTYDQRVLQSSDDAEENSGSVNITDGRLNISDGTSIVAMRFTNVTIPAGSTITSAFIEFTASNSDNGAANTVIFGQDGTANPATFSTNNNDISGRTPTDNFVQWVPTAWVSDQTYQTPDLSVIVQEIVNDQGGLTNGALALGIGTIADNRRRASSFDDASTLAPRLVMQWTAPAACALSITQSDESACMDNGTNADPNDDFFQITFNASVMNGGLSNTYEVVLNANPDGTGGTILNGTGTTYGTAVTVGSSTVPPFMADGSTTYNLTLRDQDTPTCHADYTSSVVNSCSPCSATPIPGEVNLIKN